MLGLRVGEEGRVCCGDRGAGRAPAHRAAQGGCASRCSSIPGNLREAVKLVEVFTFNQSLE